MAEIPALLPQPRQKQRIQVYLDGEFAFILHRTIAAEAALSIGRKLLPGEQHDLQARDAYHAALQSAYRYLAYRPRSESEVRSRLRRLAGPAVIDAVIAKLKEQHVVDDQVFATDFAERRTTASPRSRKMIGWELRRKGVKAEVVEDATAELDDEATAYEAGAKRSSRMSETEYLPFRQKLGGFLQRRGFGYGVATRVVERVWRERTGSPDDSTED